MKIVKTILMMLLGAFMIYAGLQHFLNPTFYLPFVPAFLPFKLPIIYLTGVLEVGFGGMLFFKKTAVLGARGILLLMFLFLPVHIWDVFRDTPAIGSQQAAWIRLPFQFLFILWAWAALRFAQRRSVA